MRARDFILVANENLNWQLKIGGDWYHECYWKAAYDSVKSYEETTHCRLFVSNWTISEDEQNTIVAVLVEE